MRIEISLGNEIKDLPIYIDEDFALHFYRYLVSEQNRENRANGKSDYFSDLEDLITELTTEYPEVAIFA